MSSSDSRTEVMKPLLIKAGISAALSAVAFICARIASKRFDSSIESLSRNGSKPESLTGDESFHSLDSTSLDDPECENQGNEGNLEDKSLGEKGNLVSKLFDLETQLEELQNREWDMETRFIQYEKMKEKEMVLMEIRNVLVLEKTRVEFLLKEVSLMEDENRRMGELVIEYVKLVHEIEGLRKENGLLERKVKKQWRREKQKMGIIKEQKLSIEARNEELLSYKKEVERRDNVIQELEDEVGQLKRVVDHMQREKIELYNKLELVENSYSSNLKIETESVTKEEYDKVLKELEQLHKAQEVEANEVTYLKWSNACLRHELMRCHEHPDHINGDNEAPNQDPDQLDLHWAHDDEPCSGGASASASVSAGACVVAGQARSRRRRFIQKFKRWVDGSGKMDDKEKNEEIIKCFGRYSVSEEAEDQFVQSRKSCSSV